MSKQKSRHQSLYEYLECLQLEYITCELRKKVYFKRKDKSYYSKTMDRKKIKIEDIAERNHLPTIFNDDKIKEGMYSLVYKEHGYPEFIYNSEEDKVEFLEKDKENYYLKGSEVRVLMEDGYVEVGTIEDSFFDEEIAHVKLRNHPETKPYPMDRVTRIL